MHIMLLVVLIVAGIVMVQIGIWVPIIIWIRRASERALKEMAAEVAAVKGERLVAGPEQATYRGSSGGPGRVKGLGAIVLTDRRILFRKILGATVEIPVHAVTGTSRSKSFRRARSGLATHLIVSTDEPADVGFYVRDLDAWQNHIDSVRRVPRQ